MSLPVTISRVLRAQGLPGDLEGTGSNGYHERQAKGYSWSGIPLIILRLVVISLNLGAY